MPRQKVLRGRTFDFAFNPVQWKTWACCDVSFSLPGGLVLISCSANSSAAARLLERETQRQIIFTQILWKWNRCLSVKRQEDASLWLEMRLLGGLGALSDLRQYWAVKETFTSHKQLKGEWFYCKARELFFSLFKSAVSGEHGPLYGSPDLEEAQHQD